MKSCRCENLGTRLMSKLTVYQGKSTSLLTLCFPNVGQGNLHLRMYCRVPLPLWDGETGTGANQAEHWCAQHCCEPTAAARERPARYCYFPNCVLELAENGENGENGSIFLQQKLLVSHPNVWIHLDVSLCAKILSYSSQIHVLCSAVSCVQYAEE